MWFLTRLQNDNNAKAIEDAKNLHIDNDLATLKSNITQHCIEHNVSLAECTYFTSLIHDLREYMLEHNVREIEFDSRGTIARISNSNHLEFIEKHNGNFN